MTVQSVVQYTKEYFICDIYITLVFSNYNVWISNDRVHENRGFMVKQVFNSQNTFLLLLLTK